MSRNALIDAEPVIRALNFRAPESKGGSIGGPDETLAKSAPKNKIESGARIQGSVPNNIQGSVPNNIQGSVPNNIQGSVPNNIQGSVPNNSGARNLKK